MRDTVLYVGGFGLPDRTASALRALGNATVLRLAGYQVLIAGKFPEIPEPRLQPLQVEGFDCHDIRQPLPGVARIDYTVSPANIRALALHIGVERIAAIMAYNYPGFGLHRLLSLGRDLGVPVINESTEWYGWEGVRPVTNVRRILESRWRNTSLVSRAGNLLSTSHWLEKRHPPQETDAVRVPAQQLRMLRHAAQVFLRGHADNGEAEPGAIGTQPIQRLHD